MTAPPAERCPVCKMPVLEENGPASRYCDCPARGPWDTEEHRAALKIAREARRIFGDKPKSAEPAERCPRCGNGRGYNHCVCPRCVRCGSSNLHLGQMGSSKCFDCGNIVEAMPPKSAEPAKAPQLSQAECEKVYAESQADIADLIKPAAAEVPKTVSLRDAFAITIKMFSELREKHDALKAERARYRKALEHIHEESAGWAAMIARKALEARDGK